MTEGPNVLLKTFQIIIKTKLFIAEYPDFQAWTEAEILSPYWISRPALIFKISKTFFLLKFTTELYLQVRVTHMPPPQGRGKWLSHSLFFYNVSTRQHRKNSLFRLSQLSIQTSKATETQTLPVFFWYSAGKPECKIQFPVTAMIQHTKMVKLFAGHIKVMWQSRWPSTFHNSCFLFDHFDRDQKLNFSNQVRLSKRNIQ